MLPITEESYHETESDRQETLRKSQTEINYKSSKINEKIKRSKKSKAPGIKLIPPREPAVN